MNSGESVRQGSMDFKEQLINENDITVDEIELHKKYTELFNVLGAY